MQFNMTLNRCSAAGYAGSLSRPVPCSARCAKATPSARVCRQRHRQPVCHRRISPIVPSAPARTPILAAACSPLCLPASAQTPPDRVDIDKRNRSTVRYPGRLAAPLRIHTVVEAPGQRVKSGTDYRKFRLPSFTFGPSGSRAFRRSAALIGHTSPQLTTAIVKYRTADSPSCGLDRDDIGLTARWATANS